jgi:hypothetical protein
MTEADEYGPGGQYADGPNTEGPRKREALETETEFLRFVEQPKKEGAKTVVIHVENKKSNMILGVISWYGPWRQYCFYPTIESVLFNHTCLHEISEVCRVRTMGRREAVRLEKERRK